MRPSRRSTAAATPGVIPPRHAVEYRYRRRFLVLGNSQSVVIDVDGVHHYGTTRTDDADRNWQWSRCGVHTPQRRGPSIDSRHLIVALARASRCPDRADAGRPPRITEDGLAPVADEVRIALLGAWRERPDGEAVPPEMLRTSRRGWVWTCLSDL